jgi:hypothetical protein
LLWSLLLTVVLLGIVQVLVGAGRRTGASSPESAAATSDAQDAVAGTVGPAEGNL